MKNLTSVFFLVSFFIQANSLAQPTQYYKDAKGLKGYELKSALHKIISTGHITRSYGHLYNIYFTSDLDTTYENDGTILDIYSEEPHSVDPYTFRRKKHRCGNYKRESDCFNREHIYPQGSFGYAAPMVSDFFHVFPTDGYVNNRRGSNHFGEVDVANAKWTSKNGSLLGPNTFGSFKGRVFEPIDEFKGDVARALLYFAVRYENKIKGFGHAMGNGTSDQVYDKWVVELLLKWHKQDPVSAHEVSRNGHGFKFQGNRNPFIDYPEFAEIIWSKIK
ncbi:MAG: endonuclease I [Thermoproteota archaeon]|jgi:endonuclease I